MTVNPPRHGAIRGYPKDADGWPLCRYCLTRCPTRRNTFCGPDCVHEWKIRSDASYARTAVWRRDAGVCAACRFDTSVILVEVAALRANIRVAGRYATSLREDPDAYRTLGLLTLNAARALLVAYCEALRGLAWDVRPPAWVGGDPARLNLWQADHVTPVEHGGGMAGLAGLQTLCTLCHKAKTRQQAAMRKQGRG